MLAWSEKYKQDRVMYTLCHLVRDLCIILNYFFPYRLDPAKITNPNPDNEVKWYYSNYNSENLEPYVDPRVPRDHIEAAKVHPSSSQTYHCNFSLVLVMLSLTFLMNV